MPSDSHLLVGLGNPDQEYEHTRHNIGFMAADRVAACVGAQAWRKKFNGLFAPGPPGSDLLLLKPLTYMNLSGESVGAALRFHKLEAKNVVVFHDDLDLPPGHVKIKRGGGSGGHNGIKSLDAHIGTDYLRVRLGIGHPGVKGQVVTNYVLGSFSASDRTWLDPLLNSLAKNLDVLLSGDTARYLGHLPRPSRE